MADLQLIQTGANEHIDDLEAAILADPAALVEMDVAHNFLPGMYIREIAMPAGTLLTSKIHKTEHVYVVLSGRVSVFIPEPDGSYDPDDCIEHIVGPHVGVTLPGTRRVLYVHDDCRWLTFHPNPNNITDLAELERLLIEPRLLPDGSVSTVNSQYKQLLAERELPQLEQQYEFGGAP